MQTAERDAEARRALADQIEAERDYAKRLGFMRSTLWLSYEDATFIAAALRAQPDRGAERMSTEQIARAMCRHQIAINRETWGHRKTMTDESARRAEDAGWQQWSGFAEAVAAAIRALPLDEGAGE